MYRSPHDKRQRRIALARSVALWGLAIFVALILDQFAFDLTATTIDQGPDQAPIVDKQRYELHDWYRFLRIFGFAGTWLIIAIAIALHDRGVRRSNRVFFAVLCAGIAAELLKLVVGRERPIDGLTVQGEVWKPFLGAFTDGGNLGFPSSHAAVAFAGAAMISALFPRLRPVLYTLATGCALSRMLVGAHWLSDVVAGAAIGVLLAKPFVPPCLRPSVPSSSP